jgi:molecular chaperone GrpE
MTGEDKSMNDINDDDIIENETEVDLADESEEIEAPMGDLAAQLESALEESAKMKDQYIRSEAEMANLRRRVEKDVENAHKFGQEKISKELLAVADNLERALTSAEGDSSEFKALKEGVELTLKGLVDVFAKFNIVAVDPHGEPFDPQVHQAMSMVENPEVEPNTVIAVMQKGYLLHGRLIRPAMVMVSKGGETAKKIDETA